MNQSAWEESGRESLSRPRYEKHSPRLRFLPQVMAKIQYLLFAGPTEVSGFAHSSAHDPLLVTGFQLLPQVSSAAHVRIKQEAYGDYFEQLAAADDPEKEFDRKLRIWIHTHPEMSANPSGTDEAVFAYFFDKFPWAVMAIISRTQDTYARLRFSAGPGGEVLLPRWEVCWEYPFPGSEEEVWQAEYEACVVVDDKSYYGFPDGMRDLHPPISRKAPSSPSAIDQASEQRLITRLEEEEAWEQYQLIDQQSRWDDSGFDPNRFYE